MFSLVRRINYGSIFRAMHVNRGLSPLIAIVLSNDIKSNQLCPNLVRSPTCHCPVRIRNFIWDLG